ncbi:hypothetical protein GCM10022224_015310 [Nonomuraea antimicrobica]|uniref:Uncharacterized protein n=1 Tax=Nonomuraea antimicrobica TaxID=561173 RepID=A0ABP7BAD4_9ACTN
MLVVVVRVGTGKGLDGRGGGGEGRQQQGSGGDQHAQGSTQHHISIRKGMIATLSGKGVTGVTFG